MSRRNELHVDAADLIALWCVYFVTRCGATMVSRSSTVLNLLTVVHSAGFQCLRVPGSAVCMGGGIDTGVALICVGMGLMGGGSICCVTSYAMRRRRSLSAQVTIEPVPVRCTDPAHIAGVQCTGVR